MGNKRGAGNREKPSSRGAIEWRSSCHGVRRDTTGSICYKKNEGREVIRLTILRKQKEKVRNQSVRRGVEFRAETIKG